MQGRIWILFWWTDDFRSVKRQGVRCKVPSLRVQEDHILLPRPIEDPDDLPHDRGEGAGVCPHNRHPNPWLFPWSSPKCMPAEPIHQTCPPRLLQGLGTPVGHDQVGFPDVQVDARLLAPGPLGLG